MYGLYCSCDDAQNDMVRAGWDPQRKLHPDNPRVFLGYNDTLYVGSLPVALFSGGHTYYIQKLHEVITSLGGMPLIEDCVSLGGIYRHKSRMSKCPPIFSGAAGGAIRGALHLPVRRQWGEEKPHAGGHDIRGRGQLLHR